MTEMTIVEALLGHVDDPAYAGRPTDVVLLDSAESGKRRLRRRSAAGRDIALDLPRGTFVAAGAVLADLGDEVLVAERRPERALVASLAPGLGPEAAFRQALALGHALGNQHVPIEVRGGELRIPVTTSEDVLLAAVTRLGLDGLELRWADVPLAEREPLAGHGHGHPHTHGHVHAHAR